MIENLRRFTSIAWDFDGTICDHPQADAFHDFIRMNPFRQQHHIVTFRSHGWQNDIWRDMTIRHRRAPLRANFLEVHNCPDELYERYCYRHALPLEQARSVIFEYECWKGMICKQIGAEVLIDDMPGQVIRGCDQYGIVHIHPDDVIT